MNTQVDALAGVRILDLSQVGAGPYAASLLGDFGADVIKVEPLQGDQLRQIDTHFGPGDSAYFFGVNRSKRSISLDLRSPAGRDVFDRLLQDADVLITSMRPTALERLGVAYEQLAGPHPHLIHCTITAFGEDGPRASEPGMDLLAQAMGGLMGLTGEPDRTPVKAGAPVADFVASFLACFAITLALRARDRDGEGQKVSLNLLDGQFALLANCVTAYLKNHEIVRPFGGGHPQIVPYQVFEAADGPFVIACLSEKFWPLLCNELGLAELIDDPRFKTNMDRIANREELTSRMQAVLTRHSRAEWLDRLRSADVPCAPVNRLEDVVVDEQILHNGMVLDMDHPRYGRYQTVNNPVRMSRTPANPRGHPPDLGEHTDAVLAEAGLSPDKIASLRNEGVIR